MPYNPIHAFIVNLDFWNIVVAETYVIDRATVMKNNDEELPEISESGIFVRSIGEPRGQIADWRTYKEGLQSGVHAVEFNDRYELHVDLFDPHQHPLEHLAVDVGPAKLALGAAAFSILKKFGSR